MPVVNDFNPPLFPPSGVKGWVWIVDQFAISTTAASIRLIWGNAAKFPPFFPGSDNVRVKIAVFGVVVDGANAEPLKEPWMV